MSVAGLINPLALQRGEPDEEQLREQARSMKGTAQGMAAGAAGLPGEIENIATALMDMKQGMAPGILPNETTLPTSRDVGQAMGADVDSPEFAVGEVFAPDPTGPLGKVAKAAPYLSHILPIFFAADKFEKIGDMGKANKLRRQAKLIQHAIDQRGGNITPEHLDRIHRQTGLHVADDAGGNKQIFYEVDDTGMTLKDPNFILNERSGKLEDFYDNPELFRLIPELKGSRVDVRPKEAFDEGVHGDYNPKTGDIGLNEAHPETFLDSIVHETEHGVQYESGQYEGGNMHMMEQAFGTDPSIEVAPEVGSYMFDPRGPFAQAERVLKEKKIAPNQLAHHVARFMDEFAKDQAAQGRDYAEDAEKLKAHFDYAMQNVENGVPVEDAMDMILEAISSPTQNYSKLTGETTARIAGRKGTTGKMGPLHRELLEEGGVFRPNQLNYLRQGRPK